jgi:hypothetical protein
MEARISNALLSDCFGSLSMISSPRRRISTSLARKWNCTGSRMIWLRPDLMIRTFFADSLQRNAFPRIAYRLACHGRNGGCRTLAGFKGAGFPLILVTRPIDRCRSALSPRLHSATNYSTANLEDGQQALSLWDSSACNSISL